jgi:hypothetical protein
VSSGRQPSRRCRSLPGSNCAPPILRASSSQPEWWDRLPDGWEAAAAEAASAGALAAGAPGAAAANGGAPSAGGAASISNVLQEGAWVVIQVRCRDLGWSAAMIRSRRRAIAAPAAGGLPCLKN